MGATGEWDLGEGGRLGSGMGRGAKECTEKVIHRLWKVWWESLSWRRTGDQHQDSGGKGRGRQAGSAAAASDLGHFP